MAKVMISIPDDLLRDIDAQAEAEHRKRSEFFKELALRYLNAKHPQSGPVDDDQAWQMMTSESFFAGYPERDHVYDSL